MKVTESNDKCYCDNCDKYVYVFEIKLESDEYATMKLCKECLLKLLKAIIER